MSSITELRVGEVPSSSPYKELVTVTASTTIGEVQTLLREKHIHSVPIMQSTNSHKIIGVVNDLDIITRLVFAPIFTKFSELEQLAQLQDRQELTKLVQHSYKVYDRPAFEVRGLSRESKQVWVYEHEDKLSALLEAFCQGVHRVLVAAPRFASAKKSLPSQLSQTDVVRFLLTCDDPQVKRVLEQQVSTAMTSDVVSIGTQTSALSAFRRMMIQNELTALPVLDERKKVVGTLSSSDFAAVHEKNAGDLLLPVLDFVPRYTGAKLSNRPNFLVCCSPKSSLRHVLRRILASRVHRAWVLDAEGGLLGALSLTDAIRAVFLDGGTPQSKLKILPKE